LLLWVVADQVTDQIKTPLKAVAAAVLVTKITILLPQEILTL
jgi:hypothetical protein